MNAEWRKGDLCRHWTGMVSRVVEVLPGNPAASAGSRTRRTRLRITQAVELFGKHPKAHIIEASRCVRLTLVDLGTEYMKLGNFIAAEAKRLSGEANDG